MHAKLTGRWRGLAAVPMDNGTRTQYPQTTATPGPSKFRMQFPHDTNRCTLKNRRISTIRLQHLKYTQGNCMRNYRDAVRTQHHATDPQARRTPEGPDGPVAAPVGGGEAWPRCPRAVAGPGRLRDDAPSKARGADGSRAGRRPRAHQATRPHNAAARPQPGNATRSFPSAPCAPGGASRPGQNGCGPRYAAPRLRCR